MITRHLLEAVGNQDADPVRAEDHFRQAGEVRLSQGIAADEMLQSWRILLEVLREEARAVARRLGIADDALLATRRGASPAERPRLRAVDRHRAYLTRSQGHGFRAPRALSD
jgi:hypothetical protein